MNPNNPIFNFRSPTPTEKKKKTRRKRNLIRKRNVTFSLSLDLLAEVDEQAYIKGKSRSEWIRDAVLGALRKEKEEDEKEKKEDQNVR